MIEIISLLFIFVYCLLMIYFISGNFKKKPKSLKQNYLAVSIIIPFRNEEKRLKQLIQSLKSQNYPAALMELIFVNDSSEDTSTQIIVDEMGDSTYKLLDLKEGKGKKMAIKAGILSAQNEFILTTDADTNRGPNWVGQMMLYFNPEKTQLVVGPVLYSNENNLWQKLQTLEFAALIASTQGAIEQNNSFLCNGANLLFRKATYLRLKEEELKLNTPSGDDVFLLHSIKRKYKKKGSIIFASSADAIVYTEGCNSVGDFLQQRLRWAGKSIYYTDFFSLIIGFIVFFGNTSLLVVYILSILEQINPFILLLCFLLKWGVDTALLSSIHSWSNLKITIFRTFFLSLLYPFYIITVAFLSLLFKVRWKGRKI